MATNIDKFLEPSELGAGNVPIGGILLWRNPNPASINPTPPTGFEYCDGQAVVTAGPMVGQTKPDMMVTPAGGTRRVVRGADVTANYGDGIPLVTGGNDVHQHGTDFLGSHQHSMQGHTHQGPSHRHTISTDGSHRHNQGAGGGAIRTDPGVFTDFAGDHDHTGLTGFDGTGNTGGPSVSSTDFQGNHSHTTSSVSSLPAFIELAYIIRVV